MKFWKILLLIFVAAVIGGVADHLGRSFDSDCARFHGHIVQRAEAGDKVLAYDGDSERACVVRKGE